MGKLSEGGSLVSVIPNFLSPEDCSWVIDSLLRDNQLWRANSYADAAYAYRAAAGEVLLLRHEQRIERATRLKLHPSYSFIWCYFEGAQLSEHLDRTECDITVSIPIGVANATRPWPLLIRNGDSHEQVWLCVGDAVIFNGRDVWHSRPPLKASFQLQLLLHYFVEDRVESR